MATRLRIPSVSFPDLRSATAWRPTAPADWRTFIWQTVTAPWWVWSDVPKLPFPARNPVLPKGGLAGDWVVNGLDRTATRIWIQRMMAIVARSIWLTLLVGCIWLVADLSGGPALDTPIWLGIGVVIMLCSLVVAVASRPSRAQVARMLDRSFGLQERVTTALGNIGEEVPAGGERASVIYLQVADAANALTMTQEHAAFRLRPPARELVMAIALGLAFAGLAFARGVGGGVPEVQSNVVPAFVPAAERFVQPEAVPTVPADQHVPTVADVQQMVQTSMDNQQDLQTLADALADHAVTSDAANLIDQGNYSAAAEELRTVANQADQLSDSAREDLANDLSQAASQMSSDNQGLSDATQQAADGLNEGGDQAKDGVRDLANAVEQSGQQVQSSEALDQAMQQAQQSQSSNSSSSSSQSQDGNQGQQSSSQESGSSDTQQDGGSTTSGQDSGQPGEAESTSGADAEAGVGQDPNASSGQPGEGAPADANSQGSSGQQQGSDENQSAESGNASGDSSQPSTSDQTGQTSDADQGSGAGSEAGSQISEGNANAETGGAAQNESAGKDPSTANVSGADQTGTDTSGAKDDPHEAVTLDRAPQGESVQIGGDSGSSSLGPGAGVTVSNGSTQQGEVGQTGPDSNHVPPEYRSIVESYFSDKDGDG